ncbi:MAG: hypothetical protein A2Z25_20755 [Planctomycetes bacterium RBG_16_55_9]|nr:MAG: hypothetical protein A2Z25_20755 [Planctomycetes bacterium RBG_16_55_9]
MSSPIKINLSGPIRSARILDGYPAPAGHETADSQAGAKEIPSPDLEAQKAIFSHACQALHNAAARLDEFCDKLFVEHREEIAGLSVEIARKVLVQKVEEGDYEIESVIKESLKNAPSRHNVVVHLNPEDYAQCRQALQPGQDGQDSAFAGVTFVPDPNIGRAECLLETPKGIIQSLIDENLERISQALTKVS